MSLIARVPYPMRVVPSPVALLKRCVSSVAPSRGRASHYSRAEQEV